MKSWKPWFAARVRKSKMTDFQKLALAQYDANLDFNRRAASQQQMPYSSPWTQNAIGIVTHDLTEQPLVKRLFGW